MRNQSREKVSRKYW